MRRLSGGQELPVHPHPLRLGTHPLALLQAADAVANGPPSPLEAFLEVAPPSIDEALLRRPAQGRLDAPGEGRDLLLNKSFSEGFDTVIVC